MYKESRTVELYGTVRLLYLDVFMQLFLKFSRYCLHVIILDYWAMLTVIYEKESVHLANNGVAKGEERLQTLQL